MRGRDWVERINHVFQSKTEDQVQDKTFKNSLLYILIYKVSKNTKSLENVLNNVQ